MARSTRIAGNIPQAEAQVVDLVSNAGWEVGMRGQPAFAKFVDYAVARVAACGGGSRAQDAALGTSFNQTIPVAPFNTAFDILSTWAERSFEDVLGPAYMLVLGRDRSGMGQFFTPFNVCQVMASLLWQGLPELTPDNLPITVHDPCVGSGGLLLAQAELYPQAWHERGYVLFSGVDLDPLCAKMAHLNMRLHRLCSKIAVGNSLTDAVDWANAFTTEPDAWPFVSAGQLLKMAVQGEAKRARLLHQMREDMRCGGQQAA